MTININTATRDELASAYVDLIGYDPFADDPGIDVECVRDTLLEYVTIDREDDICAQYVRAMDNARRAAHVTRQAVRYGTGHFVSAEKAVAYYRRQESGLNEFELRVLVAEKIAEQEIYIGAPWTGPGATTAPDRDGRYWITAPQDLKIGDKISGGRLSHYYAVIEQIHSDCIVVRYNGECRSVRIPNDQIERVL